MLLVNETCRERSVSNPSNTTVVDSYLFKALFFQFITSKLNTLCSSKIQQFSNLYGNLIDDKIFKRLKIKIAVFGLN